MQLKQFLICGKKTTADGNKPKRRAYEALLFGLRGIDIIIAVIKEEIKMHTVNEIMFCGINDFSNKKKERRHVTRYCEIILHTAPQIGLFKNLHSINDVAMEDKTKTKTVIVFV